MYRCHINKIYVDILFHHFYFARAVLVWLSNVANTANSMNMVSYLRGTMNMGVAAASTTTTIFVAVLQMFTIPAAFITDSYIKRFYIVLMFAPIEILVLTYKAFFPTIQSLQHAVHIVQTNIT